MGKQKEGLQEVFSGALNLKKTTDMIKDLSEERVRKFLGSHCVGSLGFIAHKSPHVLPVTYYYDPDHHQIVSYSTEGHKIEAMREYPQVSLLVYQQDSMTSWRSVLVHGVFEELHRIDAKFHLKEFSKGVQRILGERGEADKKFIDEFSSKADTGGVPIVYRIRIVDWSGKYRDG